jgi:hypothetical protein
MDLRTPIVMHSLTIHSKFTFGDIVRFMAPRYASHRQPPTGVGEIIGIMVDDAKRISYMIALDPHSPNCYDEALVGIFESEITLA